MSTDTIEVLTQARNILTKETWGRDELFCEDGRVCALGAVYTALGARYDTKNQTVLLPSGKTAVGYPHRDRFKSEESWLRAVRRYNRASDAFDERFQPIDRALNKAAKQLHNMGIVGVNDQKAKSVREVKAVFTAAIKNTKKELKNQ